MQIVQNVLINICTSNCKLIISYFLIIIILSWLLISKFCSFHSWKDTKKRNGSVAVTGLNSSCYKKTKIAMFPSWLFTRKRRFSHIEKWTCDDCGCDHVHILLVGLHLLFNICPGPGRAAGKSHQGRIPSYNCKNTLSFRMIEFLNS